VQQENRWREIFKDHEEAPYAHAAAFEEMDRRVTNLEKLGWQIRGGLSVLTTFVAGGLVVVALHSIGWIP
jgi:hypothetical protein